MKKNKFQEKQRSFLSYISLKENKRQIFQYLILYLILYILLKYLYPYPASISDSGAYVNAAVNGHIDTYRPFGYSGFLIFLHKWSQSIDFLIAVQYILNVISTLILIFTVKYFFSPVNRKIEYLYAFVAIFSPLTLYLSNSVLSDSLFTSLTILWITLGIWMYNSDNRLNKLLLYVLHLILLYLLIKVRYTGLVYLPVTLVLTWISFFRKNFFSVAILLIIPLLMVFAFYKDQKATINSLVHVNTFSGFSGWQSANNALHCLPYIDILPGDIRDEKVRRFTEFALKNKESFVLDVKPTATFMWNNSLPLKEYLFLEMKRTNTSYIYQWNYLGHNVYSKFGSYIIRNSPLKFAWHYLLPNCRLILYPVHDQVVKRFRDDGIPADLLQSWFGFHRQEKLYSRSTLFEKGFFLIPLVRLGIWISLITLGITFFIKRRKFSLLPNQFNIILFMIGFIAVYFAFSAYAGPFELRYSTPIHLAQISVIYIILNLIMAPESKLKKQE